MGDADAPTDRWPTCRTCLSRRSGNGSAPSREIASEKNATFTTTASGRPPSAGCRVETSSSSITPSSSPTWRCAWRASIIFRSMTPSSSMKPTPSKTWPGSHFGLNITESGMRYQLRMLYDMRRGKGLLSTYGAGANDAIRDVVDLHGRVDHFFERCAEWQEQHGRGNGRIGQPADCRERSVAEAARPFPAPQGDAPHADE